MQKGELTNGTKMYCVKTIHFVKDRDFATALTDHFYNENQSFDHKITKKEAERILRHSLFFYGLQGMHEDHHFESTYEEGNRYNEIYHDAIEWVRSKYEWLSK